MHPAIYHRFCSDNLDTTLEPQCQIQNVFYFFAPMLCQFCEERQMWTIHGLMVAFT